LKDYSDDITDEREFRLYPTEMVSGGMIYIPSFMKTVAGVQAIFLPQQSERL
jgi:hypothetical protein